MDLEFHLTKFPVTARPSIWSYRAKKLIRRHPIRVSVGVLFFVATTIPLLQQRAMHLRTEVARTKAAECCKIAHQFSETMRLEILEIRNEISTLPGGEPVSRSLLKKMEKLECKDQRIH